MPAIRATMHSYYLICTYHAEKPVFRILKWKRTDIQKIGWPNLASSTQPCKKKYANKSALALFMLWLGTANPRMTPSRLTIFAVTA